MRKVSLAQVSQLNATVYCYKGGRGPIRADIDVYTIRLARVRIIELRNDMNVVMEEMGRALEGVFDAAKPAINGSSSPRDAGFARVDGVAPGSPAAEAVSGSPELHRRFPRHTRTQGLRREDVVVQFGPVTADDVRGGLNKLVDAVNESANVGGHRRS
jgi:26S proteasome non-ATPase regulatory subunit 9